MRTTAAATAKNRDHFKFTAVSFLFTKSISLSIREWSVFGSIEYRLKIKNTTTWNGIGSRFYEQKRLLDRKFGQEHLKRVTTYRGTSFHTHLIPNASKRTLKFHFYYWYLRGYKCKNDSFEMLICGRWCERFVFDFVSDLFAILNPFHDFFGFVQSIFFCSNIHSCLILLFFGHLIISSIVRTGLGCSLLSHWFM